MSLHVEAPSVRVRGEHRLAVDTWDELQLRLERITGIPPEAQRLELDGAPLESIHRLAPGHTLRVLDARGSTLGEEEQVTKFELTDDQYAARDDSVRAFKKRHHLGRFGTPAPRPSAPCPDVGVRGMVDTGDGFERRGTVRFVGPTSFAAGTWVGIEFDEPVGKNDGSVQGTRYFTTRPRHGGFVRPSSVHTGPQYEPLEHDWEV